jgi:hypothetical protein
MFLDSEFPFLAESVADVVLLALISDEIAIMIAKTVSIKFILNF